jgi:hypothetical protein
MKTRRRRIKEWGGVPGRKNSQVFAGGLGTAGGLPMLDGVDVDIYVTGLDASVAGQHGSSQTFAVEITVEQDDDLSPDLRTFQNEEEAVLYARNYLDFLMQVLNANP